MKNKIQDNVIVSESGCWEWKRSLTKGGYGRVSIGGGKMGYAHRESYRAFKDEIPLGMAVMHSCDNPPCCNPEHLSIGSQKDNMRDCSAKGRVKGTFTSDRSSGEQNSKAKLTATQVLEIFKSRQKNTELAANYNVTPALIGMIKRGKIWRSVTLEKQEE